MTDHIDPPKQLPRETSVFSPFSVIQKATREVPVVKFAFGLAGISACGALIAAFLGKSQSSLVMLALIFIGSVLLFLFSRLAVSKSSYIQTAGVFLLWVIVSFFSTFLLLTTTAFTSEWPKPWVVFLGMKPSDEICNEKVTVMWNMTNNPDNQSGDAAQMAQKVESCDPFQAYTAEGTIAFHSGNYVIAENAFRKAHQLSTTVAVHLDL